MDKSHCEGCYKDFYNHRTNCDGKQECWSLAKAKLQTMYTISSQTPQDKASNFRKVEKPSCYQQDGMVYYKKLPEHLR